MRLLVLLILAVWVFITAVASFQGASASSLAPVTVNMPVPAAKNVSPCLMNVTPHLSTCDSSADKPQRMVLVRGQVFALDAQ